MGVPLIAAAAGVVARFIAKRGLAAATKKFTKKAVNEGKKHMKDLKDGPTSGQKKIDPATRAQRVYRSGQRRAAAGATVVASATPAISIVKLRSDLKKAKTAEQRAKLQTRIEKEIAKVKAAEQKAKDKGDTKSRTENTNTRRGNNEKVPQGTRVPTSKPGVKTSLRPKARPKNLKDGGMPMVMKNGKKVPAFAADGVGKMMKGGMAKKKPTAKKKATAYMYGGMAKKKTKK
jgi:hypothetical protein